MIRKKLLNREGFTLMELVVVIGVVSILSLLMVPNITAYVQKADDKKIIANMKGVHTAAEMAIQTNTEIGVEDMPFVIKGNPDEIRSEIARYANITSDEIKFVSKDQTPDPSDDGTYYIQPDGNGNIIVSYNSDRMSYTIDSNGVEGNNQEVVVDRDSTDLYTFEGSVLTGFDINYINSELNGKQPVDLVIPSVTDEGVSVKSIGDKAFMRKNLISISLPNSITRIESWALHGNKLKEISLPNKLIFIGTESLESNLFTDIVIPSSVRHIAPEAFRSNKLTSITLPEGLEYIGELSFSKNRLTEVAIPKSVKALGHNAFIENGEEGNSNSIVQRTNYQGSWKIEGLDWFKE